MRSAKGRAACTGKQTGSIGGAPGVLRVRFVLGLLIHVAGVGGLVAELFRQAG